MSWKDTIKPIEKQEDQIVPETKSSWRDTAKAIEDPEAEIGKLEALALGAGESASLGFLDELSGGLAAGVEKTLSKIPGTEAYKAAQIDEQLQKQGFTGDVGEKDLVELYRQYRDITRERSKLAQEEQPGAYYSGVVAGAFVPGTGAIGTISKTASTAEKLSAAAKAGALIGGVSGLGTSEADLTKGEFDEAATDTLIGTATGAALPYVGAGIKAATPFVKKGKTTLTDAMKNFETTRDFLRSYELGTKGRSISGIKERARLTRETSKAAKKLKTELANKLDENFDKKLSILKEKDSEFIDYSNLYQEIKDEIAEGVQNFKLNPEDEAYLLNSLEKRFYEKVPEKIKNAIKSKTVQEFSPSGKLLKQTKTSVSKDIPDEIAEEISRENKGMKEILKRDKKQLKLDKIVKSEEELTDILTEGKLRGDLSAEEAANFVRNLQEAAYLRTQNSPGVSEVLRNVARKAKDELETKIPEIKPLNVESHNVYELLENLKLNASDLRGKLSESKILDIAKNIDDAFKNTEKYEVKKLLENELPKIFGKEKADQIMGQIKTASQDYLLAKRASSDTISQSWLNQIFGKILGATTKAVNKAGLTQRAVSKPVSKLTRPVKQIYNMSGDALKALSEKANKDTSTTAQNLAFVLNKASEAKTDAARNALLFSIAQNPGYREYLREHLNLDQDETEE